MSLAGRHQADATAAGAAEIARAFADGEVTQSGVWLPEEVISYERFFDALASAACPPTVEGPSPATDERAPGQRIRFEHAYRG